MKMRFGLSLKLILINSLTLLMALVVVIFISNKSFESTLYQSIGQGLENYAGETALAIDHYIDVCIEEIRIVSQADVFEGKNAKAMRQYTEEVLRESDNFDVFVVVDKNGVILSSTSMSFEEHVVPIINKMVKSTLFRTMAFAKQGEVFYDDHLRSGKKFFPILLTPLTDDTNTVVLGVLIGIINTSFIEREVHRIDDRTIGEKAAYLVDDPGNVLISRDEDIKLFSPLSDIDANPELRRLLEGDRSGFTEYIDHKGDRVIAGYSDLSEYGKNQGGDWSIISIAPVDKAMSDVYQVRDKLTLIAILALFLGSLIAYFFSKGIVKPIASLAAASIIREGVYPKKINIDTNDEIADLGKSFKNMIDILKSNEQSILLKKEEAESAREEADRANRAKSVFLANMSHEIRTPMNAILGYSQILLRRRDLDSDLRESIQTIDSSGKNLLEMINEILDISKIEAGKMEINKVNFDLTDLMVEISNMFAVRCRQKRLYWKIEGLKESCMVSGDELKLRAILINLIGNAEKFTSSGEVGFKISPLENDRFMFEITDTGRGIALKDQQYILEPFHQGESGAKMGGTGLGLAISSKQLVLMGTELQLESELDKGSRFYFTLFLPPATGAVSKRKERIQNILYLAEGHSVKALVVDDIKANRDVLAKFLEGLKVDVIQAVDGRDGLEKVREHLPDIIFMDIRMPVMDGKESIEEIHKEFGKERFKIVVITASAFDNDRVRFAKLGAHDFITKPFRAEQIVNCLDELLNVKFEYEREESTKQEPSNGAEPDYSKITLPEDLYSTLKEAAELYNVSQMETVITKLESMDENCNQLAFQVSELMGRYEMDGITEIAGKLKNGKK